MSPIKPQCETAAQCLRELARVMEQFGIERPLRAVNSRYVKYADTTWGCSDFPHFPTPNAWKFALAGVEGKLVFPGDELYSGHASFKVVTFTPSGLFEDTEGNLWCAQNLSWNPPKPKTVTVPYTISEAKRVIVALQDYGIPAAVESAIIATKKALGELK